MTPFLMFDNYCVQIQQQNSVGLSKLCVLDWKALVNSHLNFAAV